VRYRVLGSIEVADDGRPIAIGRGKPRLLLAALLIDANRAVSVDELIERLWSGQPPSTATKSVQVLVSQLRRALGALGRSNQLVSRGWLKVGSLTVAAAAVVLAAGPLIGTLLIVFTNVPLSLLNLIAGLVYVVAMPSSR
jgi:hypothetical protein